jgi:lysyl-tRNA synthetase class 2
MELDDLEQHRMEKMELLREGGMALYPLRSYRTHTAQAACDALEEAEAAQKAPPAEVTVTGRLVSLREMGKISFAHIEDATGRIQLFLRRDEVGKDTYNLFKKGFDLGDFVEATGPLMRTRTGEISVLVKGLRLLAKAITPLPYPKEYEKKGTQVRYAAFTDVEERYRQRYADLAVNPQVREVFRIRSKMISALRTWLDNHGYLEVETPVLQPIYGGAAALPFTTYHNQLKQELYLRISFELYLKRLLVGMYERVYEIGRDFRNEGVSYKHNPEFTQLELYCAYTDLYGIMETTEQMIASAAQATLDTTRLTYQGNEIDLTPPWRRISLHTLILQNTGIDYKAFPDAASLRAKMRAEDYGAPSEDSDITNVTWGHLVDNLLSEVEPSLIQPTFIHDYPVEISPFAKHKPDDPTHVERFELFIGGMEMANAFTELNDPFEQERRFIQQGRAYEEGDEEAQPMDEDYIQAMKYGMPPNGGLGVGIDRLAMLFTDQHSIREVLLYPHLRPKA